MSWPLDEQINPYTQQKSPVEIRPGFFVAQTQFNPVPAYTPVVYDYFYTQCLLDLYYSAPAHTNGILIMVDHSVA